MFILIYSLTKDKYPDKSTKTESRTSRRRHITLGPGCKRKQ